ncbi:Insulin-like growth factor binding protein, N-terminal [Pseudocohnilembus persalinus]|uniref:Insulin-like growth factor binding protein, N-terminal n=1 Tax=Pseudocohnilembus persalinus TaxID=266149 RepID=A0A0V0QBL0_PSEPJ|nr:Insulin-like growth factor binding protein, N-terminal [Pseudocohnilembus persalinus]|eukprot:KRW99592.1 Insulin-like growth factor binding protein, N-terminal [Pseudocohnilembus persalinus]
MAEKAHQNVNTFRKQFESSFLIQDEDRNNGYQSNNISNSNLEDTEQTTCTKCVTNYFPSTDGSVCYPKIASCKTYDTDTGECTQCDSQTYLASDGSCAEKDIDNCSQYNTDGKCTQCDDGYFLGQDITEGDTCHQETENCKTYSADNSEWLCTECNEQDITYILQNNQCYLIISNCETQDGESCMTCEAGYHLSSDTTECYADISNCATYDEKLCSACDTDYHVSVDKTQCYDDIANCQDGSYNDEQCTACESQYNLSQDQLTCYDSIENCTTQVDAECSECAENYKLSSDNLTCYEAISNCKTQDTETTCSECEEGYHISSDNTICHEDVEYCQNYDNTNKNICSTCIANYIYYSTNNICYASFFNCADQVEGEYVCNQCDTGYHLNNNEDECVDDVDNCIEYDTNNEELCGICEDTFSLNASQTFCYTTILNCANQAEEVCNSCDTGYHLSFDTYKCYADIENCQSSAYDEDSNYLDCLTCINGYHLGVNADVAVDDDTSGKACFIDIENCSTYSDEDGSSCTQCEGNEQYYLYDNSICLDYVQNCQTYDSSQNQCSTCLNGYHIYNGECAQDIDNCTAYSDTDGSCTECEGFYVLSDSQCVYGCSVENCATCSDDFYCDTCNDGYTLSSSKRSCDTTCPSYSNILNCETCTEFVCSQCSDGYFINSSNLCSTCKKISSNCTSCSSSACTECEENYILFEGKCRSCEYSFDGSTSITGCSVCTYASSTLTCSDCEQGYYLSGNKCNLCSASISNCSKCSSSSACTSCASGYYLNDNDQCSSCSTGMLTCYLSSGTVIASTCKDGYFLDSNTCTQCESECLTCKDDGLTCTSCSDGQYLYQETCVSLTDGEIPQEMETLEQVYNYSIIQSYFRGNSNYYQFFDSSNSNNVCSADADCINGNCKIKYCECDENYFGTKCQYSSSDSSQIQTATQLYENIAIQITNFFELVEQDLSSTQVNRFMQTAIQLQNGLYNNYVMTSSNKSNLKSSEYAKKLKNQIMERYFINLQNSADSQLQISEYSVKGTLYKVDPTSDESPDFVLQENSSRRVLIQQIRVLQTEDMDSVQTCTFSEVEEGISYISQTDYDSIIDYVYDNSAASDSTITLSMMSENNLDFYQSTNITIDTIAYTLSILDSDGNEIDISDLDVNFVHHLPKADQDDIEDSSDYYCYNWNSGNEEWNENYIDKDKTDNCDYYVICSTSNTGTFAGSKDILYLVEEEKTESSDITAKKLVSQPGFIINASLLFLLLILLIVFSFLIENHPEKQKTKKKVHLPQISSDYKKKRDQDQKNFEQAEKYGMQYQNRSIIENQMQKSQMNRSHMNRSQMNRSRNAYNSNPYTNNNLDGRSNFQINPPRSNRFDTGDDFQPQFTESRFVPEQQNYRSKISMLPQNNRANAYLDSQPSEQKSDRYLHNRGSLSESADATPKNNKVVIERNINPWMLYHFYSIYHTHQTGLRLMKISLMIGTLQFYCFMLCIFFGYTEANIGYALAWVMLTIIATWVYNYLLGSLSLAFRNQNYGSNTVHPIYWGVYFIVIFLGFSIGSVIAAYDEPIYVIYPSINK